MGGPPYERFRLRLGCNPKLSFNSHTKYTAVLKPLRPAEMNTNIVTQMRTTQARGLFAMPKLGRARQIVRAEPKETSSGQDSYSVSLWRRLCIFSVTLAFDGQYWTTAFRSLANLPSVHFLAGHLISCNTRNDSYRYNRRNILTHVRLSFSILEIPYGMQFFADTVFKGMAILPILSSHSKVVMFQTAALKSYKPRLPVVKQE